MNKRRLEVPRLWRGLERRRALAAGLLALAATPAAAEPVVTVAPGVNALGAALARAPEGATVRLDPGTYRGNVTLARTVRLVGPPPGEGRAVVDAGGTGDGLVVDAPNCLVRGLTVTGSGADLNTEDSGIFLTKRADRSHIRRNRIVDNLIGVYLKGPRHAIVADNLIRGRRYDHMNERGNGVQVWNAPGSVVMHNDIRWGRDGIFTTSSDYNAFYNNRLRDLRYGVHYMYTNRSHIIANISRGNHAGYALMYSKHLHAHRNLSVNDRDHGLMFNFANSSTVVGNIVRDGEEKCAFFYNSNKNVLKGNRLKGCAIGIHFTAGSARNEISANALVNNRTQVKYVGTRWLDWSKDGRGNYWSDHASFDLDGDGIADTAYRPNDRVDHILWKHPLAKLLISSPGVQVLRAAQRRFPNVTPGGVVDTAPLAAPPAVYPPHWTPVDAGGRKS